MSLKVNIHKFVTFNFKTCWVKSKIELDGNVYCLKRNQLQKTNERKLKLKT